jgi:hypothetical protein
VWDSHPLENAAFARRTPQGDDHERQLPSGSFTLSSTFVGTTKFTSREESELGIGELRLSKQIPSHLQLFHRYENRQGRNGLSCHRVSCHTNADHFGFQKIGY